MAKVTVDDVKAHWEAHSLSAEAIAFESGTPAFFKAHERMRFRSEPAEVQAACTTGTAIPGNASSLRAGAGSCT